MSQFPPRMSQKCKFKILQPTQPLVGNSLYAGLQAHFTFPPHFSFCSCRWQQQQNNKTTIPVVFVIYSYIPSRSSKEKLFSGNDYLSSKQLSIIPRFLCISFYHVRLLTIFESTLGEGGDHPSRKLLPYRLFSLAYLKLGASRQTLSPAQPLRLGAHSIFLTIHIIFGS